MNNIYPKIVAKYLICFGSILENVAVNHQITGVAIAMVNFYANGTAHYT